MNKMKEIAKKRGGEGKDKKVKKKVKMKKK